MSIRLECHEVLRAAEAYGVGANLSLEDAPPFDQPRSVWRIEWAQLFENRPRTLNRVHGGGEEPLYAGNARHFSKSFP